MSFGIHFCFPILYLKVKFIIRVRPSCPVCHYRTTRNPKRHRSGPTQRERENEGHRIHSYTPLKHGSQASNCPGNITRSITIMGVIYYKYRNKILQSHTCITLIGYRGKKRRQREPDAAMEEGWMDVYTKSRWAHVTGTFSTFSGTGPEPGPALTGLSGFYQTGEILI